MLAALCTEFRRHEVAHTLRVCVDGPDAVGKTTLADELAARLQHDHVIRLSVDRFHRPAAVRRRQGSLSPHGYYTDSFDLDVIIAGVLRPLGPGGDGWYLRSSFDYRSDSPTEREVGQVPSGAILLFDGVFMLRPELRDFWDLSIYLRADPEVIVDRARRRDLELFGSVEVVEERYRRRYLPGQDLYRSEADPEAVANIVLDMNDPAYPTVVRWSTS